MGAVAGKTLDSPDKKAPGKRRGRTQQAEDWAVRRVNDVVADDLKWFFRAEPLFDYGVDAQAEVVADDALVTGRLLGLQIKGGDSYFGEPKGEEGWVFRASNDHLAYWLGHSLPIIVVLVNPERQAFWQVITTRTIKENKKGFSILVPRSQPFDGTAQEALLTLAGRRKGLLEQLPSQYAVLPPTAVMPLRRAEATDQLAAARLAERLADGRASAGMTAASLIAASPSWLVHSTAAQDLWIAVAVYAGQHNYPAEAGKAFAMAADVEGPRSARSSAEAGLALMSSDRDDARRYLQRGRDEGQVLLADIGLSMLEVPEGAGTPAEIPQSVSDASPEDLQAEPTTLAFLAEMAGRRGDLNAAVGFGERAVASAGDRETVTLLALARLIQRRALSGGMSRREFRRAVGYAREAVEERRRWDGPSVEALAVLLDIYIPHEMAAAVQAALPAAEGGTALDGEASSPEVARRGAAAALAIGNEAAYRFFMERVPDGPHRRELLALEADATGRPAAERVAEWTALLEDAADDQMAARNVAALAKLGIWPAQADELRARSLIPADTYDMLRAIYRARSEDPDIGIARLRELAASSAHAAFELVEILGDTDSPDSAIEEAGRQLRRWPVPGLMLKMLDLLGKHGHDERAAELIEQAISDDSLPADVRLRLANWYVARKGKQRKFADAAAFAAKSLEIGEDPDLAWNLVKSLHNGGKVTAAREALARHRPEPVSDDEMRLWMQLHLGVSITPGDAQVMVGIVQRQPDGQFRDAVIGLLVREVLLTAHEPGARFSAEVTDAVRDLQEQAANRPGSTMRLASDDDDSLRAALESIQPDPAAYHALLTQAQEGRASLADVARFAGRPYAAVLLHRPAGLTPAIDLKPGLRRVGEDAAAQAIQAGSCVVDLSALYLLGLVDEDDRLRVRAAMPKMIVAHASVSDATLTRDQMRGLAISTYTASLRPDGTVERTTLTTVEQATLREQSEALEALAASLETLSPASRVDAAADTMAVARKSRLTLWCDDIALRQKARQAGVRTFSLLDLITAIERNGSTIDQPALFRRLAADYVVDLPLTADDITAIAAVGDWDRGPAHTALARPEWWQDQEDGWTGPWLRVAAEACKHSAAAFLDIIKAALFGSTASVSPGQRTRRYQQLVVFALVACHDVGRKPPAKLLAELAEAAGSGIAAPRPPYVLHALIAELEKQSPQDAVEISQSLLPGIDLF
jgi:Domain of unknown function (DUF4365)